jgi:plasmid maintenance system antidote protein VapI
MIKTQGKIDRKATGIKIRKYMDLQDVSVGNMIELTGLHRDTVQRILRGDRGMTLETIAIIAGALEVEFSVLVVLAD